VETAMKMLTNAEAAHVSMEPHVTRKLQPMFL
jgi:hypothetical protein